MSIVYIGYIRLIQLIQMDRCSVLPPHRDLIHFLLIFKKNFFKNFSPTPLKTLDKSSTLCYNVSTINKTTIKTQKQSPRSNEANNKSVYGATKRSNRKRRLMITTPILNVLSLTMRSLRKSRRSSGKWSLRNSRIIIGVKFQTSQTIIQAN